MIIWNGNASRLNQEIKEEVFQISGKAMLLKNNVMGKKTDEQVQYNEKIHFQYTFQTNVNTEI